MARKIVHEQPKRTTGPTSILEADPKIIDRLANEVRSGAPYQVAAMKVGIHRDTLKSWMVRGDVDAASGTASVYAELSVTLRSAEADAIQEHVDKIRRGRPVDSIAYLRMRWPAIFAERLEITGAGGGPIALSPVLAKLSDDELDAKVRELEARIDAGE